MLIIPLTTLGIGDLEAKQRKNRLAPLETLGQLLYNDENLSLNGNQSCRTCHHPAAKFADPENVREPVLLPVSDGSNPMLFGGRNAPTAAYAKFSPPLQWDGELFIGGMFWDGRASGNEVTDTAFLGGGPTYDPLADQAKGPFQNPVEMALAGDAQLVDKVLASSYAALFEKLYKKHGKKMSRYNFIAVAIAEFEKSRVFNRFDSRFDAILAEQGGDVSNFGIEEVVNADGTTFRKYVGPPPGFRSRVFSYFEADGLALFNADSFQQLGLALPRKAENGAMCYLCHLTTNHDADTPPLFTDFSYDNLGIPVNPQIAQLTGNQPIDYGLGARVNELDGAIDSPSSEWGMDEDCKDADCAEMVTVYPTEIGKFRVSTLRNIARTAPYGHNGFFASLADIVNFYNERDKLAEKQHGLFAPEVAETVNVDELGNLGLTPRQEKKIVAFLNTLTDR